MPKPRKMLTEDYAGCWFDCARGRYIGEEVIDVAESMGMEITPEDQCNRTVDGEYYHELWDEAEEYMQQFAPDDYYFGSNEAGDWGLWEIEEE